MVDSLAIFLVLVGAFIGAFGSLLMKKSIEGRTLFKLVRSRTFWFGASLYMVATIFYVFALKRGELSFLYPLVSTTYIWTTLLSVKFLGEKLNKWKLVGVIGIIMGVILIGFGS
ncbi:hypothetical protein COY27_03165 [Candidatus Woesearchaeota archaeon CG_4_10_14_0_2_um_filter_33_13]|nr:MAG: hypothetical protein COY27_03165 [Candidatus Woesearchaeota archaeon CG_4_10_14_0_2_um_filter_33_13]